MDNAIQGPHVLQHNHIYAAHAHAMLALFRLVGPTPTLQPLWHFLSMNVTEDFVE
jgi:hypothetical protein